MHALTLMLVHELDGFGRQLAVLNNSVIIYLTVRDGRYPLKLEAPVKLTPCLIFMQYYIKE
jgi:hypothetical protein